MWVILLQRSKDSHEPGADQLPKSLLKSFQGLDLAREGFTCCSVPWLWACAHSHADPCGCAGSREHPCPGWPCPNWFSHPELQQPWLLSLHPLGTQHGLGCRHPAGGIEASELVCWLRQKIWALLWANSATKTSPALQACCCSGNLKPPISYAITSCLSLLLQ